jgi:plasmid stabilization system protein ParE
MKVLISVAAEQDLAAGKDFYSRRGWEIGEYFLESILAELSSLSVMAGIHAKRFGLHCLPCRRFPWTIYYAVHEGQVMVLAILDDRRDPEWVRRRMHREE